MQDGSTPLHVAAMEGHMSVVQALLGDPRVNPGETDEVRAQWMDCYPANPHNLLT